MQVRVTVPLDEAEFQALADIALSECRNPKAQLVWLIRQEAQKRGLLLNAEQSTQSVAPVGGIRNATVGAR